MTGQTGGRRAGYSPLPGTGPSAAVVVSSAARRIRKELRPMAWTVLEEVALDAVVEHGRLVSRTSARRVADQLGVDLTTAASSLRVLRQRGFLALERQSGPAGRFGLSIYVLMSPFGLTVIPPRVDCSNMADPYVDVPEVRGSDTTGPGMEQPCLEEALREKVSGCPQPAVAKPTDSMKATMSQGALDLGLGPA